MFDIDKLKDAVSNVTDKLGLGTDKIENLVLDFFSGLDTKVGPKITDKLSSLDTDLLKGVETVVSKLDFISEDKLAGFVNKAVEKLNLKDAVLYIPEKFSKIKDLIKHSNVQTKEMDAGFMYEKDGNVNDYTFKNLVSKYKDDLLLFIKSKL